MERRVRMTMQTAISPENRKNSLDWKKIHWSSAKVTRPVCKQPAQRHLKIFFCGSWQLVNNDFRFLKIETNSVSFVEAIRKWTRHLWPLNSRHDGYNCNVDEIAEGSGQ